jgi:FAD/FMN-containing dehydrogenase
MDLKAPDSLRLLHAQSLAEAWTIQGRASHRLTPKTANQVSQLLHWAQEHQQKVALTPQHAGLLPDPYWLDVSNLQGIRQYPVDDFVIEVETGTTVGALRKQLAINWQTLPLSYPDDRTIGEILAQDEPSLETGLRGYPRDMVLKTEIVTPDGQLTISGADVVKNVTGYDLGKLYVGSQHAFGVLTSVTLKLAPLPTMHRQWLYSPSSLQEACSLADRLLASNLPLSVCEIFQQGNQWHLLIEIAGEDWTLVEYRSTLNTISAQSPQPLDEETGHALKSQLQTWPPEETMVEIALPLAHGMAFALGIARQSAFSGMRLQLRPAAGLLYLSAPLFPSAALHYLKAEVAQTQGFIQIRQIARADAANFSEALALYGEFNLPAAPSIRRLLKDLKKGYDPSGILFTPTLPL